MIPTEDLIEAAQNNTEEDSIYVDIYHSAESGLDVGEDDATNVPQSNNNSINRIDSSSTDYKANFEFIRRNKFEVFTAIIGLVLAILDWFSDIIQGTAYFFNDELAKGFLTLGTVFICGLVSLVIFESRRMKVGRTFTYSSGMRWCMSFPSIQSIVLSIKVALVALYPNPYRMKHRARFVDYKRGLQREATIFKRIETTLESAPQVLLQLYLIIMELSSETFSKKRDFLLIFKINAALLSFFTIFTSIASVSDALRGAYMERFDNNIHTC
ncbi:uncharacterized protein LOC119078440 isoform X2 [Bradysia coprophila]|uniref:uncharacterized protein LOC119078440 isoform X2 n=1 Tax=Bradysia coprophila TaxID=38358 RepID=UPI00187DAADC|nr:uncharacterized protein LOC119078440 isoform X2 [Bradysia coprophila]